MPDVRRVQGAPLESLTAIIASKPPQTFENDNARPWAQYVEELVAVKGRMMQLPLDVNAIERVDKEISLGKTYLGLFADGGRTSEEPQQNKHLPAPETSREASNLSKRGHSDDEEAPTMSKRARIIDTHTHQEANDSEEEEEEDPVNQVELDSLHSSSSVKILDNPKVQSAPPQGLSVEIVENPNGQGAPPLALDQFFDGVVDMADIEQWDLPFGQKFRIPCKPCLDEGMADECIRGNEDRTQPRCRPCIDEGEKCSREWAYAHARLLREHGRIIADTRHARKKALQSQKDSTVASKKSEGLPSEKAPSVEPPSRPKRTVKVKAEIPPQASSFGIKGKGKAVAEPGPTVFAMYAPYDIDLAPFLENTTPATTRSTMRNLLLQIAEKHENEEESCKDASKILAKAARAHKRRKEELQDAAQQMTGWHIPQQ